MSCFQPKTLATRLTSLFPYVALITRTLTSSITLADLAGAIGCFNANIKDRRPAATPVQPEPGLPWCTHPWGDAGLTNLLHGGGEGDSAVEPALARPVRSSVVVWGKLVWWRGGLVAGPPRAITHYFCGFPCLGWGLLWSGWSVIDSSCSAVFFQIANPTGGLGWFRFSLWNDFFKASSVFFSMSVLY